MSTPSIDAFARAQALGTLAARRVAWSRGYLVALSGLFAAKVAAFDPLVTSETIRDGTSLAFAIAMLVLPQAVKQRRARRGMMVTGRGDAPRSWVGALVMSAVALAVYTTLSLPAMAALSPDVLLAASVCIGGGAWLGWSFRRIRLWEHGVLGLALTTAGFSITLGSSTLGWGLFGVAALICGTSLHLQWVAWERRCR